MKKIDLVFVLLRVPTDFVMLVLAGMVSYWIRYQEVVTQVRPVFFDVNFEQFISILLITALVGTIVFAWSGLYAAMRSVPIATEFKNIFLAVSTTLLIVIIAIFLRRELFSSRFIILAAWILSVLFVFFGRLILRFVERRLREIGFGKYHIVIIGKGQQADVIASFYLTHKSIGKEITRIASAENLDVELSTLAAKLSIDEIILADSDVTDKHIQSIVDFCDDRHTVYRYIASLGETQLLNIDVTVVAGLPIVTVRQTPLDGWGKILKRLFDTVLAFTIAIILSPVMLLIICIVKLDSRGPAIVKLNRVGQFAQPFTLYKFRSMIDGADQMKEEVLKFNERADGPLFKMKSDPRITRVGSFLRRASLDELPQLFNVLKGDMSLVGPRPHEPNEVQKYARQYRKLLTIKPGITGAAQVSGRSKLPFDQEAKLDIYYIENWSLVQDIKIIAKTPKAILDYKNVY